MRNPTKRSRLQTVIAAAVAIMVMTFAAPAFADSQAVVVQGVSVNGGVVSVSVRNVSLVPRLAMVSVQAVVNDTPIWGSVPVTVNAGQSAVASVPFVGSVSSVPTVSIAEGPNPI